MANIKWELLSEKERQAMVKIISSDNILRGMPSFQEWCAAQHRMQCLSHGRLSVIAKSISMLILKSATILPAKWLVSLKKPPNPACRRTLNRKVVMANYSNFPFGDFTVAEVFALARESKEIGDDEFVKACMEAIRLNKCRPTPYAMFIAWAFERHCKKHLNADFEVCDDPACQVACEFEEAAQPSVQADGATCAAPDCDEPAIYTIGLCSDHAHPSRQ